MNLTMLLKYKLYIIAFALMAMSLATPVFGQGDIEIDWTGEPVDIRIPVNVERVLKFPGNRIQVGYPTDLWGIVSAESSQGVVLLRTTRPLENVRVRFRDKDTGSIYSFNVTAKDGIGRLPAIAVLDGNLVGGEDGGNGIDGSLIPTVATGPVVSGGPVVDPRVNGQSAGDAIPQFIPEPEPEPINHGVTTLVRFAMQNVYSPERLIEELDDVSRINFDGTDRDIKVVPGVSVKSRVLGQWRNNDRYITAIYLQNTTDTEVSLDPRILTGRHYWDIAALMSSVLTPANTFGDSTTLVAISDRKWTEYSEWLY